MSVSSILPVFPPQIPLLLLSTYLTMERGMDPAILGGASSICSGIGQLLRVVVSFIFSAVSSAYSMTIAYRVFFCLCFIGLISCLLLKETGRKPATKTV